MQETFVAEMNLRPAFRTSPNPATGKVMIVINVPGEMARTFQFHPSIAEQFGLAIVDTARAMHKQLAEAQQRKEEKKDVK